MLNFSKSLLTTFCAVLFVAGGCAVQVAPPNQTQTQSLTPNQTIIVDQITLRVQVARTPQEQEGGLSGLKQLQTDEGMLFPYSPPSRPTFWMKGMLFPIDILWIQNGRVVRIDENIQPPNAQQDNAALARYSSPENIDAVLEVQAGWARAHDTHIGSTIK